MEDRENKRVAISSTVLKAQDAGLQTYASCKICYAKRILLYFLKSKYLRVFGDFLEQIRKKNNNKRGLKRNSVYC
jgi:hypothetical protein